MDGGRECSSSQGLCQEVSKLSTSTELLQATHEAGWVKAVSWCLCTFVTLVNLLVGLPPKNKDTSTLAWLTQHVAWLRNTINVRTEVEMSRADRTAQTPFPPTYPIPSDKVALRRAALKRSAAAAAADEITCSTARQRRKEASVISPNMFWTAMNARRTPCHAIQYTRPSFPFPLLPTSRYATARLH